MRKMEREKCLSKNGKCFETALIAVDTRMDRRCAALIARLPLSIFQYLPMHKDDGKKPRTELTAEEEETIISAISRYRSKGFPSRNDDTGDVS